MRCANGKSPVSAFGMDAAAHTASQDTMSAYSGSRCPFFSREEGMGAVPQDDNSRSWNSKQPFIGRREFLQPHLAAG